MMMVETGRITRTKIDAREARCTGLIAGYAIKDDSISNRYEKVNAIDATKENGPFLCPKCLSDAIHKNCSNKSNHFAHKANFSSIATRSDTLFHDQSRDEILEALRAKFPVGNWNKEVTLPASEENSEVRADMLGTVQTNRMPSKFKQAVIRQGIFLIRRKIILIGEFQFCGLSLSKPKWGIKNSDQDCSRSIFMQFTLGGYIIGLREIIVL